MAYRNGCTRFSGDFKRAEAVLALCVAEEIPIGTNVHSANEHSVVRGHVSVRWEKGRGVVV